MNKKINLNIKFYIFRIFLINFLALIYLSRTYSFDVGFISIQSLIYSLNIYLTYFFIFFEAVCALLNQYGLDLNFYKLVINNLDNLNYYYVRYILYENINIIYFVIFSTGIFFYLEKKNYKINLISKLDSAKSKFFTIAFFLIFVLSIINPSQSHEYLTKRIKGLTNTWTEFDIIFHEVKYYDQNVKNNFLRNDNWYNTVKFSFLYSDTLPSGARSLYAIDKDNKFKDFKDFKKIIYQKDYNNIYVIINESYPNFRNQNLKNNLFQKIISNNNDLKIQSFKKKWNRSVTTQGSEMEFFCNKDVDFDDFAKTELGEFLEKNNCWFKNITNKNLVYIHSFKEDFFNRTRYKKFFHQTYFREDLYKFAFKKCDQKFRGICDHEIINNMDKLLNQKDNNFVIFLTVNNHIPAEPITKKKYLDCENVFPLNLRQQFCTIYNNQMFFNENFSNFLKRISKNDLVVFFSDTPPMFSNSMRVHFEDTIDVHFFSKK